MSLWRAVESRELIGQATGIWMERHDLSADRAFALIVKLSQKWDVKIDVVAAQIVSARPRGRLNRLRDQGDRYRHVSR